MAIMPGASRVQKFSGNRHRADISKIVLHTTEGSSWPGYGGGGSAPHFTVKPGKATESNIRQHIDTAYAAKALVNRSGGVQTNNEGVMQIEFIGSCDKAYAKKHGLFFTEDATDEDLEALASVLAWIHKTHGVPLTATGLSWPTTNAAYASAPQRMSFSKWNGYKGVCGHTHVPENDHWDPGNFPITRLLELARGGSVSGGGTSAPKPGAKGKVEEDGRLGTETVKALQRALGVKADGRACESTWTALQAFLGTPKDGAVSHQSYRAEELGNGVVDRCWRFTGRGSKGSKMVKALQLRVGVKADGVWYEGTTKALQKRLNTGRL